jgi:hypothetical protein
MPELKRNFLKGKMNKDLDERLVPPGEYRDALNVEVETSEGSNVGSLQNLKGNSQVSNITLPGSYKSQTVGSFKDTAEDKIYNFIHKASDFTADTNPTYAGGLSRERGVRSDVIEEFTPNANGIGGSSSLVLVDVYEVKASVSSAIIEGQTVVILNNDSSSANYCGVSNVEKEAGVFVSPIKVGMTVEAVQVNRVNSWTANNEIKVIGVSANATSSTITFTKLDNVVNPLDANAISAGVVLSFKSKRILNFSSGQSQEQEVNTQEQLTTYSPKGTIISAINKIDDFLLFTDGRNEPKKINIKRFKRGSFSIFIHSELYVYLEQKYTTVSTLNGTSPNSQETHVKESHITTIRPNPNTPPIVETQVQASIESVSFPVLGKESLEEAQFANFAISTNADDPYEIGQSFYIKPIFSVDLEVNDILSLTGQTSSTKVFVKITSINVDALDGLSYYTVSLQTVDEDYAGTEADEAWLAFIDPGKSIYKDVFINFAYRYTYTDGEKSCISPYSKTGFLPGLYAYSSKNGFNLGMENQASSLIIRDFIPFETPQDVVKVELLFKTSESENVYMAKTFKRNLSNGQFDNSAGSGLSSNGTLTIQDELFGTVLESSQLNRSFDGVPKKAVAQEIMANRLMYGNYYEDYDLKDSSGNSVEILTTINKESNNYDFYNSFNSTNNLFATGGARLYVPGAVNRSDGIPIFTNSNIAAGTASTPLPLDIEYDPGDNYDPGTAHVAPLFPTTAGNTSHYTVPFLGDAAAVHTFSFEVDIKVSASSTSPIVSNPQYRIGVFLSNGSTIPQATGSPLAISPPIGGGFATEYAAPGSLATTLLPPYENVVTPAGINTTVLPMSFSGEFEIASGPEGNQNKFCFALICVDAVNVANIPRLVEGQVAITQSPDNALEIQATQGVESVKSDRHYQVGVVYRDAYGRESSVLVDESNNFSIPKTFADKQNNIVVEINNNAPAWAETYKFFVKETTQKYHNLVLEAAFDNNDGEYAWLVFNSVDRNKVKVGDHLSLKKQHGSNTPTTSEDARWKIIDIEDNGTENEGDGGVSVAGVPVESAIIADASELIGKFFVKVNYDVNFITYIANLSTQTLSALGNNNGAVFETEPSQLVNLDLYYEVGQAYPIRLNETNIGMYIKPNMKVKVVEAGGAMTDAQVSVFNNDDHRVHTFPSLLRGARSFGIVQNNPNLSTSTHGFAKISIGQASFTNSILPSAQITAGSIIKFIGENGGYVTAKMALDSNGRDHYILPYTHSLTTGDGYGRKIMLPWFNCYSFGNGVESDTIKDDFNESTIYPYPASGKQSGFKASIPLDIYKENHRKHQITFSSLYNDKSAVNRLNEFLLAEDIVKTINPEYGSIQKLFSRNNDLVTLCEDKCLKVLSQKDALFNADGNSQLLSSTNVLGQAVPFAGDYGISKNPESFAVDEFRIYFADKSRGTVLRLSGDGLTPISNYGMQDWFNDRFKTASALVGSFDSKKNEYNLVVHETINEGFSKNIYNVSFNEASKGWVSFKSFMHESGVTLNNIYYTFKNGAIYQHHKTDTTPHNNFYGYQYVSSVTPIFNDGADSVKNFNTVSYEGSQSKVDAFTNVPYSGDTLNDDQYYNAFEIKGWYLDSISTDLQEGGVNEFIKKEGKWYNYIKGVDTSFTNSFEGETSSNNLDTAEFSVQGLGAIEAVSIDGAAPESGVSITIEID